MLCANFVAQSSGLADDEDDDAGLCCGLTRESEMIFSTDSDIFGSVERLRARAAGGASKKELAMWSQAWLGFEFLWGLCITSGMWALPNI